MRKRLKKKMRKKREAQDQKRDAEDLRIIKCTQVFMSALIDLELRCAAAANEYVTHWVRGCKPLITADTPGLLHDIRPGLFAGMG